MMNLSLLEIAEACGGTLVLQGATGEEQITSLVLDSRQVTASGAFLATVGERVDGHRFVKEVYDKGVTIAIVQKTPEEVEAEHGVAVSSWKSYVLVKDSFQALKDIAEYYRRKLEIPIVGITGSVGKTSTKEFIAGVLSQKYNVLKTEGNFNNEVGLPLTLLRIRPEHEVAVVEMGISDFGEMHRLSKMARPDICVITNIGQCHLENLKTRDGILQAKTEIFDFMSEDGEVCLNGEDDKLRTIEEVNGKKPHFFGLGEFPEDVYADNIVSKGLWGSDAVLHIGDAQVSVEVPLPGQHMVTNAAAAACVAELLDMTGEQIAKGMTRVSAIGGRNNLIRLPQYTLIDDCYNANPVSMKAAIDLLNMADTGKVAILGDMFELGANSDALHAEVGAYAAENGIHRIYCVGENSRHMHEAALKVATAEQRVAYFETRDALLDALEQRKNELIPKGCTVLIKASHGMAFTEVLEYLKD